MHAVVPIKARQPHQVPRSTATLLLATQTAVAHAAADGTRPVLQSHTIIHAGRVYSALKIHRCVCLTKFTDDLGRQAQHRCCGVQTFSPSMGVWKTSSRFCFTLLDVTTCCKERWIFAAVWAGVNHPSFQKILSAAAAAIHDLGFTPLLSPWRPGLCCHCQIWNSLLLDFRINGLTSLCFKKKIKTYLITTPLNTCQLSNSQIMFYCLSFSVILWSYFRLHTSDIAIVNANIRISI